MEVFLSIFTLINLILCSISFFIIYKYKTLHKIIDDEIQNSYTKNLSEWRRKRVVQEYINHLILYHLKLDLDREKELLIKSVVDGSIRVRLNDLSQQLAENYTLEHFEDELKKHMLEKLGNQIKNNILGYD